MHWLTQQNPQGPRLLLCFHSCQPEKIAFVERTTAPSVMSTHNHVQVRKKGWAKEFLFARLCLFIRQDKFSRTIPRRLPLNLMVQSWVMLPASLDQSFAKGDCNCHDRL